MRPSLVASARGPTAQQRANAAALRCARAGQVSIARRTNAAPSLVPSHRPPLLPLGRRRVSRVSRQSCVKKCTHACAYSLPYICTYGYIYIYIYIYMYIWLGAYWRCVSALCFREPISLKAGWAGCNRWGVPPIGSSNRTQSCEYCQSAYTPIQKGWRVALAPRRLDTVSPPH
jgi:hypothetical protein